MSHLFLPLATKRNIPLVVAIAATLTACSGEQLGNTNDGIGSAGNFGDSAAAPLLVVGGLFGLGAILDSDDSSSGLIVTPEGNDANDTDTDADADADADDDDDDDDDDDNNIDNGGNSDNNSSGDADGSDNSNEENINDDTNNGTEPNDNDSVDPGENNNSDSEGTLVPSLEPPEWLLGMWSGSDSNQQSYTGFVSPTELGVTADGSPMLTYTNINEVCFHLLSSTDSVFEYTIWYPGPDNAGIIFNEKWINNGDNSVLYTVSGAIENQFTMHASHAINYLNPPDWLQGSWASHPSGKEKTTIADISVDNIFVGSERDALKNYRQLAGAENSVIRVVANDGENYKIELAVVDTENNALPVITGTFRKTGENRIVYTGSDETSTAMTRQ